MPQHQSASAGLICEESPWEHSATGLCANGGTLAKDADCSGEFTQVHAIQDQELQRVLHWEGHVRPGLAVPVPRRRAEAEAYLCHLVERQLTALWVQGNVSLSRRRHRGDQSPEGAGEPLTAGWSLPSVFSRMAKASFSRLAASLYLFWSLQ